MTTRIWGGGGPPPGIGARRNARPRRRRGRREASRRCRHQSAAPRHVQASLRTPWVPACWVPACRRSARQIGGVKALSAASWLFRVFHESSFQPSIADVETRDARLDNIRHRVARDVYPAATHTRPRVVPRPRPSSICAPCWRWLTRRWRRPLRARRCRSRALIRASRRPYVSLSPFEG